jgi:hypothetical protein
LLGLSNTAGVLAGVLGTAATGYILQHGKLKIFVEDMNNFIISLNSEKCQFGIYILAK